jgi:hypothetical protein
VGARVAELGSTLQSPLPGFEDAANRISRRVHPDDVRPDGAG